MGVLIVEDSAFQARIMAELLKPIGTAIFVAGGAKEAHEILQTVQISLIISDLYMPKKEDGMQFIRRVKATRSADQTELFVCTIDGSMETYADLKAIGVHEVFVKPFNASDMLKKVREIFWCDSPDKDESASGRMIT